MSTVAAHNQKLELGWELDEQVLVEELARARACLGDPQAFEPVFDSAASAGLLTRG